MSEITDPAGWAILGVLAQGPAHGYDIHHFVTRNLGSVWQLGLSRTYSILTRLEKEGLVVHDRVEQPDRPAKKIHRLTESGSSAVAQWLTRPVDSIRDLRLEFLIKLFFAGLAGQQTVTGLLAAQKKACRERLAVFREMAGEAEAGIDRQAADYRVTVTAAVLDWLEDL